MEKILLNNCSYIINYKEDNIARTYSLNLLLDWIAKYFPEIEEIIIVEQSKTPTIHSTSISKNRLVMGGFNDKQFNRSWGFNIGANTSKKDILIFSDVDILIKRMDLINSLKYLSLKEKDCVNPYKSLYNIHFEDALMLYENNKFKISSYVERAALSVAGGMVIIKKDKFYEIGGWDEAFEGWGGEDTAMSFKIEKLLKYEENECIAYHIHHPKFGTGMEHPNYNNNVKFLEKLMNFDINKLKEYCSNKKDKIGKIDKYVGKQ